jgi:hypothetical protein
VHYDFEKAIQLPAEMKGSFDRIICDPPFLSEDCQTKGIPKSESNDTRSRLISNSCVNRAMADQIMDTGVSTYHCMHWRAYGEPSDHQTVWKGRHSDY